MLGIPSSHTALQSIYLTTVESLKALGISHPPHYNSDVAMLVCRVQALIHYVSQDWTSSEFHPEAQKAACILEAGGPGHSKDTPTQNHMDLVVRMMFGRSTGRLDREAAKSL